MPALFKLLLPRLEQAGFNDAEELETVSNANYLRAAVSSRIIGPYYKNSLSLPIKGS